MKKILVVCQHYYPENFQITDICESLSNNGYEITALVGLPNYPEGYVLKEYKNNKNRIQEINGVHIIRCNEIGRRKNKLFLALNYLSFWVSSLLKIKTLDDDYDLVIGYETSPITMVDAGRKYAKKHKIPFYLFCVDIWPECLKVYIKSESNLIYRFFKKISKDIYYSADKVFCTSMSFIEYLEETHHIEENKLKYIPQFGDDKLLNLDLTPINNNITDLVFMGNIGQEQNLDNIIHSLKDIDNNYIFHIVGDGSNLEYLKSLVNELELNDKIKFYGRKNKEELLNYYKLADACILSLRNNGKIGHTLPNKLQNYLAAGKPVLGMISGSAKKVIEEAKCGLCVEGNEPKNFTKIVKKFIEDNNYFEYSMNSKTYYKKNFTKEFVMKKIVSEIENI